jgi:hypothetical protein
MSTFPLALSLWNRVLLEKVMDAQLVNLLWMFGIYYCIRKSHLSPLKLFTLSSPVSQKSVLLDPSFCTNIYQVVFPRGFSTVILYTLPISTISVACLAHLVLMLSLDHELLRWDCENQGTLFTGIGG